MTRSARKTLLASRAGLWRVSRLLLSAQAVFFVALGMCVALDARGLGDNHGWSYCEGRADTAVPYLMGLPARVAVIAYAAGSPPDRALDQA